MSVGGDLVNAFRALGSPFNFQRPGPFGTSENVFKGVLAATAGAAMNGFVPSPEATFIGEINRERHPAASGKWQEAVGLYSQGDYAGSKRTLCETIDGTPVFRAFKEGPLFLLASEVQLMQSPKDSFDSGALPPTLLLDHLSSHASSLFRLVSATGAIFANAPYKNVLGILGDREDGFDLSNQNDRTWSFFGLTTRVGALLQSAYNQMGNDRWTPVKSVLDLLKLRRSDFEHGDQERDLFAGLVADTTNYIYSLGFIRSAASLAKALAENYGELPSAEAFFETETGKHLAGIADKVPNLFDVSDGAIELLHSTRMEQIKAGVTRALFESRIPAGREKILVSGAGGLLGSVLSVLNSGSFTDTLLSAAAGGAATYLVRSLQRGFVDPTTAEAFEIGESGLLPTSALVNGARLVAGAAYTGSIAGILTSIPTHAVGVEGNILLRHVSECGLPEGLERFWGYASRESIPGVSFDKTFFNENSFYRHTFWQLFDSLGNSIANSASLSAPLSDIMFNGYKTATAGYMGATMLYPGIRNSLQSWMGETGTRLFGADEKRAETIGRIGLAALETAMVPAAYFMARDLALLWGVRPNWAPVLPLVGGLAQVGVHWVGGGKLKNIDGANFLRNFLVPALYASAADHMVSRLPHSNTIGGALLESLSVQVGLIPIGEMHRRLLGFPAAPFWFNKGGRSIFPEFLGNGVTILGFGGNFANPAATLIREILQPTVQCPWASFATRRETAGSPMQAGAFKDGVGSEGKLLHMLKVAGNLWNYSDALGLGVVPPNSTWTQSSLAHSISTLSWLYAFPLSVSGLHAPFAQKPDVRFYTHTVYDMLVGKNKIKLADSEVQSLLEKTSWMTASRGYDENVERLVIAIYAAQHSEQFGDQISAWIKANGSLLNYYGIDPAKNIISPDRAKEWLRTEISDRHEQRRPFNDADRRPENNSFTAGLRDFGSLVSLN